MILKFIILVIAAFIIDWIGTAYLRNKFNIEKRKGWARSVNKIQTGIEIFLFIVYMISLWFFMDNVFLYILGFISILNLFRAFMHWKYEPEKKQYILFLFEFVAILVFMAIAYWWIFV